MDERENAEERLDRWLNRMDKLLNTMDMTESTEFEYVPDEDELDIEQGDMDYPEENEDGES